MLRIIDKEKVDEEQRQFKQEEWATAFKATQTEAVKKRKEEAEKIKKENMMKKFREMGLASVEGGIDAEKAEEGIDAEK